MKRDALADWVPIVATLRSSDPDHPEPIDLTVGDRVYAGERRSVWEGPTIVSRHGGPSTTWLMDAAGAALGHLEARNLTQANWTGGPPGAQGIRGAVGDQEVVLHQPDWKSDGRIKQLDIDFGLRHLKLGANGELREDERVLAYLRGKSPQVHTSADDDVVVLCVLLYLVRITAMVTFNLTGIGAWVADLVESSPIFFNTGW